jgi:hypothetical protein
VDAGDRHRGRGSDRGVHQKPHHLVIRRQQSETTQLCKRCITARLSLRFGVARVEEKIALYCVCKSECLCAWYSKAWSGQRSMFHSGLGWRRWGWEENSTLLWHRMCVRVNVCVLGTPRPGAAGGVCFAHHLIQVS